jgi:hypothetical protein
MLLFQTHHYQPNGAIKTNGCHARFKCRVCHQLDMFPKVRYFVHSCEFYFEVEGFNKYPKIKLFHLHHVTIFVSMTLLSNTIRVGFIPICQKKELKNVDLEFQIEVGHWASISHLQDYKIYGTMIKIFIPNFLSNLL